MNEIKIGYNFSLLKSGIKKFDHSSFTGADRFYEFFRIISLMTNSSFFQNKEVL